MPVFRNLIRITEDNIEELVPRRGGLLLLACLRREDGIEAAQAALARTGRWFDDLAVGFAGEDILAYLMERFHFNATPTFLLLRHGAALASFSGAARAEDLIGFVRAQRAADLEEEA